MPFEPDTQVGHALARLQDEAERHVREIGRFAERNLSEPVSCEEGLGRVCVANAIRSGLLLQCAIATALEISPDYQVRSPFVLIAQTDAGLDQRIELDIAAYRASDRTLFLLEVVRTYSNLAHSRRKALMRRLTEAACVAPCVARQQGWPCEGVQPAIITGESFRPDPPAGAALIPLERFHEVFGVSARGTVHAVLAHLAAGLHARLTTLGY